MPIVQSERLVLVTKTLARTREQERTSERPGEAGKRYSPLIAVLEGADDECNDGEGARRDDWATVRTLLLAALTLLVLAWPGSGSAPAALAPGKIAFQSNREGNYEIYVMNVNGSRQTRLTKNRAYDGNPSWSPDGRRIAFESNRDGKSNIYVMNADGSGQTRLTRSRAFDGNPAWSRDGKWIAFRSNRAGQADIYVMKADGSGQRNLTRNPANDSKPTWSPDGKMIAFRSDRDGYAQIYTMSADGSNQTRISPGRTSQLIEGPATDASPAWSPDGKRIAFDHNRTDNNDIYTMNADGTGRTRLTNNAGADHRPDWNWQALAPPSGFNFGRVIHNRRAGTARLALRTSPGELILHRTKNVRRFARVIFEPGRAALRVRPRGRVQRRLARAGRTQRRVWVKVRVRVTLKR